MTCLGSHQCGLRRRRGQDSKLGLSIGPQSAELPAYTHVQAHTYTYPQCCDQGQIQKDGL